MLDTGSTRTNCVNGTDGSHAVVWEFASFRIRPGVTVRILGLNPAILLVHGDVLIESGGRLLVRGNASRRQRDGLRHQLQPHLGQGAKGVAGRGRAVTPTPTQR